LLGLSGITIRANKAQLHTLAIDLYTDIHHAQDNTYITQNLVHDMMPNISREVGTTRYLLISNK